MTKKTKEATTEFDAFVAKTTKEVNTLTKSYLTQLETIFSDALSKALSEPGVEGILLQGSTPSFNDGDICRHSMDIILTEDDAEYNGFSDDEFEDDEEVDDDSDDKPNTNKVLPFDNSKASESTIDSIGTMLSAFEHPLEEIYGTDWRLIITKNANGKVEIEQSDYNPEY